MMKIKTTLILLTLLLSASLVAQDSFIRSAIIDPPSTYPSGFGATLSGVDLDGDGKLEIYSVDGMSDFMTGDEIPQIIKYEQNGTAWDSVWAASFPNERQNTWAALTTGDLDGDGKMEIIWGYVNSFSANTTPPRIVVFEVNGDDILGVSDGAGNFAPNAAWDMDIPESTNMRPLKWETFDIDADGKEEVIFAERRDQFNFGIISVDDVPDAGSGSEIWTMEFNKDTELYNQFQRSGVIESPDGGFGNVVSGVDLDGDGLMDLYAVNNDWNDGPNGELIPTMYKYELVAGAWILKWTTIVPGISDQNTWPVLLSGDMDNDGLGEIIFCPVNNLTAGNEDPSRIVVYETNADSSDNLGIDNGDGTYSPNARWNMGVPASTEMRPFSGLLADVDNDGTVEFVFGERKSYYSWGVASVTDIPNTGDGSEVWTMEAAWANFGNGLNITFEDDSDIANWSHHDESNVYTTEAYNATAGVGGTGALELGDGGYAFLAKRAVSATAGSDFSVSVDIKTEGWGTPETYHLYLIVEGFANPDTVEINSDAGFTTFTLTGTATGNSGYIKIAGGNTAGQNYVWVDNLVFDSGTSNEPLGGYTSVAFDGTMIYMMNNNWGPGGSIYHVDGANGYAITKTQNNPMEATWRSNGNSYDIDGDGNLEIIGGDYNSSGTHAAWVFTKDADSLKGGAVADFTANTANRVTATTIGDIDGDGNADIIVGFRGTDEVMRVEYNGSGDVLDPANYTVSSLDIGVLGDPGTGQIDIIVLADVDDDGGDEVFYAGPPRGTATNTLPLTVGSYSDTLKADATRRWDMVVANGAAHFFNGGGNLQSVYHDGNGYKLTKTQPGLVNGSFLSASAVDVDGDGIEEIIQGNWFDAKVNMLKWINGAWVAYEIADFTDVGGNRLNGGAVGDIDGDGNIDFVTGSRASVPNGQIYRVEYSGGDVTDASSWTGTVIDVGMNDLFSQYEVINIANLDDDADLEVLYTSDYARGPNGANDAPFPIVILDLQKVASEPIANVRIDSDGDFIPDNLGAAFVIKGVVTSPDFQGTRLEIFVQDETAGIQISASNDSGRVFNVGDLVQISGVVDQYKGATQFAVADPVSDILVLGTGTVPQPMVVSVEDWLADGEKYEGSLIKLNAITKVAGDWPGGVSYGNFVFTSGYTDFTFRVDTDTDIDENVEPTYPINSVGIAGQYTSNTPANDGYQIVPRFYTDIEQDVAAPPHPYFFFTDETAALDGAELVVSDVAAGYPISWHPAVDLNDEALIYQVVGIMDGSEILTAPSDNDATDTVYTPSGQDIINLIAANSSDNMLTVDLTIWTVSTNPSEGIVSSVDTITVTLKDMVTDIDDMNIIPKEFFVDQNYPNPFNPSTTIQFGLPTEAKVNLIIYDILGREVARLVDSEVMAAGVYQHTFDASKLASGTYIYRLQADQKVEVKKMLLLK